MINEVKFTNMKNWIARRLIDICCKQALKYDLRKKMLLEQEGIKYIYAVGSNVYERDRWLKRIERLQDWIGK
jgi:hypothetical protein